MTLLFGMPGGMEWILIFGVISIMGILPLLPVVDIVRSEFKKANDKLIWIIVVLFMPLLASLIYFSIGRSQKITT